MDNDKPYKQSILSQPIQQIPAIDWELLAKAQQYYQQLYKYKETPYLIPMAYNALTKPHSDTSFIMTTGMFNHQPHELVGSAEQGFIYLLHQQQLTSTHYFSISPCFRSEVYDLIHFPWFMKLELFQLSSTDKDLQEMIHYALSFFKQHISAQDELNIIQTSDVSWDITLNNIEIGSYGIRHLFLSDLGQEIQFLYGTGLALPRFSQARFHYG